MTKILMLHASKSMRNSLGERLNFENYAVSEADNLTAAQDMCRASHFDVAIVDGDIAFDELHLPTIVITTKPNIDSAVEALRRGAIDYLSTPIDMNRLLDTLRPPSIPRSVCPSQRRHATLRDARTVPHSPSSATREP